MGDIAVCACVFVCVCVWCVCVCVEGGGGVYSGGAPSLFATLLKTADADLSIPPRPWEIFSQSFFLWDMGSLS